MKSLDYMLFFPYSSMFQINMSLSGSGRKIWRGNLEQEISGKERVKHPLLLSTFGSPNFPTCKYCMFMCV